MADFLTEKAQFVCNQGGFIKCKDSGNSSVTYSGSTLLTDAAKFSYASGPCAIMTAQLQSPQLCITHCSLGKWFPVSPMKTSNGNSLLTDSVKNSCSCGGLISVQLSGVFGKLTTGFAPASMTTGAAALVKVEKNAAAENNSPKVENSSAVKNNPPKLENSASGNTENLDAAAKNKNQKKSKEPELLSKPSKNLFCSYDENSEKCKACPYPRTPATVNNNSGILREHYAEYIKDKNNRDEIDNYYLTVKDKFKFQAHHIISGDQIFAPMQKKSNGVKFNRRAKLVRLANFCGYDINNAKNCIMLVAGFKDEYKPPDENLGLFDLMSLSKLQRHVGEHRYTFSNDELKRVKARIEFYTKKSVKGSLSDYVELVSAELDKITNSLECSLTLRKPPVCFCSPNEKRKIIERLNALSKKIKLKLGAFTENPQKSFPYYVSRAAFLYAFDLPETAKLILVRRAGEKFLFEKFSAKGFAKTVTSTNNETLIFNPHLSKNFKLDTRENKIDCIAFCENVEYFILADGVNFEDIKFLPKNENFVKNIGGAFEEGARFLQQHDAEILSWLKAMQGDYQYTAISKKIKDRIEKLEAST